jgi:hypothetical protein
MAQIENLHQYQNYGRGYAILTNTNHGLEMSVAYLGNGQFLGLAGKKEPVKLGQVLFLSLYKKKALSWRLKARKTTWSKVT